MRAIDTTYIDGSFVAVSGTERLDIVNPATETSIGTLRLGSRRDARRAIDAASRAQASFSRTTKRKRLDLLRALAAAVLRRSSDIRDATIAEYGAPLGRARWISQYASDCFTLTAEVLTDYEFSRRIGDATVLMEPVGVSALFAPWNAAAGTICSKLASALAAGCACVVKPSEFAGLQAHIVAEAIHDAGLPAGLVNFVNGRGQEVGDELARHPRIARVSFTGSTPTGKVIAGSAVESMKRVSLSLSGKAPAIILDDADLAVAVPLALRAGLQNNGQACIAATRILVPVRKIDEVKAIARSAIDTLKVGLPTAPDTELGPLASRAQFERVQRFIAGGIKQGATLVAGGPGRPDGFDCGYFVRPTIFGDVSRDMEISREEIFGPVISIVCYRDEDDAIELANDTDYGLFAYVWSGDPARAQRMARELRAGEVLINRIAPELRAPFGGVKQSGLGREFGVYGLESFLEPKSIVEGP